jgi:hypothetical protein
MVYIAAACERCPHVSLVDVVVYVEDLGFCACGGTLEALPGRSYPAADYALFHELSDLVNDSDISGRMASELAERLTGAQPSTVECLAVLDVIRAIPRTIFTLRLFDTHPQRFQQAVAMLAVILSGRARARHSEEVARHDASFVALDDAAPESRRHG